MGIILTVVVIRVFSIEVVVELTEMSLVLF